MSNTNAVPPFLGGSLESALEAIGITQFPSGTGWFQTIGGLLVQGDLKPVLASASLVIPFLAVFPKQVLGVWIQPVDAAPNGGYVNAVTLAQFTVVNGASDRSYYWWAIGV